MIEIVRREAPKCRLKENGECVRLAALREGRPVFSVLTGVDRRFVRLSGEARGWFSQLEGEDDPEAARALIGAMAEFQRALGMASLAGPVSPDGRFQPGIPVEAGDGPRLGGLLTACGFQVLREYAAFRVEGDGPAGMREAAARARKAHGVSVRREGFTKAACRAAYGLYEPRRLPFEEFAGALNEMRPLEIYIASVRGADAGFALALREGRLTRVETVMVAPPFRRGPALLCLLDALRARSGPEVETGAIDRENAPSLAVVRALGGRISGLWRVYHLYLK